MILIYTLIFLIVIAILYILSLKTNKKRNMDFFLGRLYAHRGIHDNKDHNPENSILAFQKAIDLDYGIELDVHVTKDNIPVVFHDETLKRVCGLDEKIEKFKFEDIKDMRLFDTDEPIPTLQEILELVDGKVPLLVEIKNETRSLEKLKHISKLLEAYKGKYVIESFNPLVLIWYKKNRPEIIRGQLATHLKNKGLPLAVKVRNFILENFMLNFLAQPDFIAYNYKYKNSLSFKLCKQIYEPLTVAFTIKNQKTLEKNLNSFDLFVFDSFIPNSK